jgi:hypothetical protein
MLCACYFPEFNISRFITRNLPTGEACRRVMGVNAYCTLNKKLFLLASLRIPVDSPLPSPPFLFAAGSPGLDSRIRGARRRYGTEPARRTRRTGEGQ